MGIASRNIVKGQGVKVAMREGAKDVGGVAGNVLDIIKPGGKYIGTSGSSSKIRILQGGAKEAEKMFAKLSKGGTVMKDHGVHKLVKMPDSTVLGYRTVSTSGPPTIDVHLPKHNIIKLKYLE